MSYQFRLGWSATVAALACLLTAQAQAYEMQTHQAFSQAATTSSASVPTGSTSILADLNLSALQGPADYVSSTGVPGNALDMISVGARAEDILWTTRPFNHFHDPQFAGFTGRGLTRSIPGVNGRASPDRAIEDQGDVTDLWNGNAQVFSCHSAER